MFSTLTDNNREMIQVTSKKMKMTIFENATQEVICVLIISHFCDLIYQNLYA